MDNEGGSDAFGMDNDILVLTYAQGVIQRMDGGIRCITKETKIHEYHSLHYNKIPYL